MKYPALHRPLAFLTAISSLVGGVPSGAQVLPDNVTLTNLNILGQPRTLQLYKRSVRSTNFHYMTWSNAGGYATNSPPPIRTYRGTVAGATNTIVCATIKPGGLLQADGFDYEQGKSYTWQLDNVNVSSQLPAGQYAPPVGSAMAAAAPAATLEPESDAPCGCSECGGELPPAPAQPARPVALAGALPPSTYMPPSGGMQVMDLGVDITHYRYVNTHGSDADLAVCSIEHKVNIYDHLMARDAMIAIQETVVVVRQDIFYVPTSMGSHLNLIMAEWKNTSAPLWSKPWDQVHSFQTEQGLFGAGGYAWGNSIGKDESPASVEALYHEAGHNWDVVHIVYGADTMGGNRPNHGPFSIDRLLRKRSESISEGDLVACPGIYPDPLPPYTHVDCASTLTNTAVNINVLTNDWDGNSNALTVIAFSTNTTKGGTVSWVSNGVLRYTPASGYVGKDLFAYTVRDSTGLKTRDLVHVEVVNRDLEASYAFEETDGKTASDASGNGHPGKLQGVTDFSTHSEPGVAGLALRVDGGGVICDNSPLMPADAPPNADYNYWPFDAERMSRGNFFDPMDESCTIAFWFKTDDTTTTRSLLRKQWHDEQKVGFNLTIGGTAITATVREFNGLLDAKTLTWSSVLAVARWYHVALQFDRSANLARLYVDGVQRATGTLDAGRFIFQGRQPLLLGMDAGGQVVFDEFRYYSKALSGAEMQALYSVGHIAASGPSPADGERDVALAPVLTWVAGRTNYQHDAFFGTNLAAVASATTNSAQYVGRRSAVNYTPGTLATNMLYFWRVDEILGGTNVAPGEVWSFTTAPDSIHGGLKLQLTLDSRDTVGSITYDRAGPPSNDGALFNTPVATNGQVAEAIYFNSASNHYIEVPALNMPTDTATLLAWVRRNGTQVDYSGMIFHRGTGGTSGMNISTANRLGYHWNDAVNTYNFNSGLTLPDGQWALAAVVVETNRAVIYLGPTNGVLASATNNVTHALTGFGSPLRIASDSGSSTRYLKGAMDEIGIWRRALTRAEIGQILTNGIRGEGLAGARPVAAPNTFTWIGDTDAYWTNSLNWATNAVPGAAHTVYFNDCAAGNTGTQLGTNLSVAGVHISGGIRGIGISGTNTLTLGAGGILMTNTAANLALDAAISLGGAQTWTVPDGSTLTLANKLSGSGNPRLTKHGAGRLNLNNNTAGSSYAGVVVVNGGTLSLPAGWGNPSLTGNVSVGTNGTLIFNSHPYSYSVDNYTTNAGTIIVNGDNHLSNLELRGGQVAGLGNLRVGDYWGETAGGKWVSRASSVTAAISVASLSFYVVNPTFTVEDGTADPDLRVSAQMKDGPNGSASFTKAGTGSLTLTEPSIYTGNTTNGAGTINLSSADDILPVTTGLHLAAGSVLNLNNYRQTVVRLTGSGAVNLGYGTFTVTESAANTFGGVITGSPVGAPPPSGNTEDAPNPGGFTKTGTGKVTLSGNNTYTGDTLVASGTLALSGSGGVSASSNLVVSSGATLDVTARTGGSITLSSGQTLRGNGKVLGGVLVNSGATLSPGESVGALITGAQTWAGGGSYIWEISHANTPSSWDSMTVTGAVTVTATTSAPFILRLVSPSGPLPGFNSASNYTWTIATTTGGVTGFAANKLSIDSAGLGIDAAGGTFSVEQQGNNLALVFTAHLPPVRPLLTSFAMLGNGTFTLSGTGGVNQAHVLIATTNLAGPITWAPLATGQADLNGVFTFTDPQATNYPQRFYRVTVP